ncbi:hypothetical protein [Ruminococcus sp.]|uniref:hypothetical protein n=1 Tax=Ruminococcus sp. TaxID=41978 RepID=UPI0025E2955E|nr:hypothetical protein [Ruminococcus sp.]
MTKPCEACGQMMVGVKGDRWFCNACAIRRRKAYQRAYREKKATHGERDGNAR